MSETTYSFPEERREPYRCPDCQRPVSVPMRSGEHARRQVVTDGVVRVVTCQVRR